MILHFILLNITFIVLFYFVLRYKEHKKSLAVFFLMIFTVFYGPSFYYIVLSGTAYSRFNSTDLIDYMMIGSMSLLFYSLFIILKNNFPSIKLIKIKGINTEWAVRFYFSAIFFIVAFYVLLFRNSFPLIQSLLFNNSILRPDTTGSIPYYFTFSVFMHFILPSFYFYILQNYKISKLKNTIILSMVVFFLIIGGNKGILVYFFIFYWVYIYNMRINFKIILMAIFSVLLYKVLGAGFTTLNEGFSIITELSAPFRRFFVTQGAMLINRIDMVNSGFEFDPSLNISTVVSRYVYGIDIGAAPTYFIGDLIIKYGKFGGFIFHLPIVFLLFIVSKNIDKTKNIFNKWSFFSIVYILGMSGLGDSFTYRTLAIVLNLGIVSWMSIYNDSYKSLKIQGKLHDVGIDHKRLIKRKDNLNEVT